MRSTFVSLTGAIVILAAGTVSSPARGDEFAFQRLAGLASADVSANMQALRDDFALAPSEAERLGAAIAAALSDGTAVRAVTFALILMVVGAGLEWFYWTFAAAPLRAITSTTATTPRHAVGLASRRLAHLGFGVMLFTASTMGAALILPWPPNVEAMVIAATALVVAVRSAWIIADVVVSPHHPSLRLTATQEYNPGFVVGGVTWLMMLAAAAVLLPQLLTTVGSAPHLAGAIRVGMGGLVTVSLLAAVLIAFRREGGNGNAARKRPRFPRAFIASFLIVATAILALVGDGRIARSVDRHRNRRRLARRVETYRLLLLARCHRKQPGAGHRDGPRHAAAYRAGGGSVCDGARRDRGTDPDYACAACGTDDRLEPVGPICSACRGHCCTRLCRLYRLDRHSLLD